MPQEIKKCEKCGSKVDARAWHKHKGSKVCKELCKAKNGTTSKAKG